MVNNTGIITYDYYGIIMRTMAVAKLWFMVCGNIIGNIIGNVIRETYRTTIGPLIFKNDKVMSGIIMR